MKTSHLFALALLSSCIVDPSAATDEPVESTVAQDLEIAGAHPCLTEAADLEFYSAEGFDGVAVPFGFGFTHGSCKSLVAETTQTKPKVGAFPLLYTFVRFPSELATTELECLRMSSFERAYVKTGTATNWTFVGEVHRYGAWNNGTCSQLQNVLETGVNIPAAFSTKRTIRIVASAAYSNLVTAPVILFDTDPIAL
jgi:hypothetical protein